MREAKRVIYDNYDLWAEYAEGILETLRSSNTCLPENDIWKMIYEQDYITWQETKKQLVRFFDNNTWVLQGRVGRWNGVFKCSFIFQNFMDMFHKASKDCSNISIYDKRGHFFLECCHHDGSNSYEVKKITNKGITYYENWIGNSNDKRSEEFIHDTIIKRYSVLPRFVDTVYGKIE